MLFAIPIARALYAEARFPGRGLILRLFALPLALPALVAVLMAFAFAMALSLGDILEPSHCLAAMRL
ncbi:thiamin ABC transporter membrane component and ATP-binding component [Brucella neotomae]|nr:putative thiamin ABC transporter membrane component [Brucella neotomae 5K33]SPU67458.1 thiamin ABC transporter membrane component and ATP-binding component [Brucella neotomae]SPU70652.1 thiamin ABC transporter membrane component and ATP-binding component [Brucella neotomae]SUW41085.1 thiamin ABC transporter membrane component and ATP-binding component [Brucella neotomae]